MEDDAARARLWTWCGLGAVNQEKMQQEGGKSENPVVGERLGSQASDGTQIASRLPDFL
jgi:hypothetical protein